tara:strand:+ start:97 stop:588 length:492 start_codon:yes stop_codon:yes gene_type:complete
MNRDLNYEINNIAFDWQYPDGGIKCKNYEFCEEVLPKWFECKANYLCINCDMTGNGIVKEIFDRECPICLEVKRSVKQPNCEHTVCIDCFKKCHDSGREDYTQPEFPYPDIEDEYDDAPSNPKWETDYPLIKIFNEELNKLLDEQDQKYIDDEHLRKCPLCRR